MSELEKQEAEWKAKEEELRKKDKVRNVLHTEFTLTIKTSNINFILENSMLMNVMLACNEKIYKKCHLNRTIICTS